MEDDMIAKFIDNPLNAMVFVEYAGPAGELGLADEDIIETTEPKSDEYEEYTCMKKEVKRIVHLDKTFSKFEMSQEDKCNLLCIGTERAGKSTLINEIFNLNFETIRPGTAGLFHDSVDVTFAAKDFNIGFNIFDFQGRAN